MKRLLLFVLSLVFAVITMAQSDRQYIRNGNKLFRQQNFVRAESEYRKSLSANSQNTQALYNLGCALMMQNKDSAAIRQFELAGRYEKAPRRKAMAYHNIGVICQGKRLYAEAIEAYKESLRNNPDDDQTRYNLVLCKRLQKQQKNNKKNQQKNDSQKPKQQQKNDNNKSDNKARQSQNSQDKMSKDNAEQLLNAAIQNEQATQRRVKAAMHNNKSRKLDKNW